MADMFKQIGSLYLYDNQLNREDYLILGNRKPVTDLKINEQGELESFETGEFKNDLDYFITAQTEYGAFGKIQKLDKNHWAFKSESIKIMREACEKQGLIFIHLKEPLHLIKVDTTHMPNYNAYHIYYNETVNGKLGDYQLAHAWKAGETQYSTYRLYEYCNQKPE